MRKIMLVVFFIILSLTVHAQYAFAMPKEASNTYAVKQEIKRHYTTQEAKDARRNDAFLAFVPGAVQYRRRNPEKAPILAYCIWGGMATTAGLACYEQIHHIVKLQNNSENDPSNANWYDEEIRKHKKIRDGALLALGGVYVFNYISALLMPDRSKKSGWLDGLNAYADFNGTISFSYSIVF